MSSPSRQDCPTCGARLEEGEDVCKLCGESVSSQEQADSDSAVREQSSPAATAAENARVYCTVCGAEHSPEANFCSKCGSQLEDSPTLPPEAGRENDADGGQQKEKRALAGEGVSPTLIGGIVGGALLLVIGLFVITAVSQDSGHTADPLRGEERPGSEQSEREGVIQQQAADLDGFLEQHEAQPLPAHIEDDVREIRSEIEELEGEERWARKGELVNLFQGSGLVDRAAIEQRKIAEDSESTGAWERTGSLMHDWMASVEGQNRALIAQLTVEAYENVLEAQPENHDARVNMATALIDTNNPMRGVEEIQYVLEAEPEHIQARFNYAIMQAMIGRIDEAIAEFELVKEYAGENSPHYREAEHIIDRLEEAGEEGGQMPGSPDVAPQDPSVGQQTLPRQQP